MKKLSKFLVALNSLCIMSLLNTTSVFAAQASSGNAVYDIMNNPRFTGAVESIEWLTLRVDYWFTVVISATAFFIISTALLKNACAGAYVANHKFWDKVAEAHEKSDALSIATAVSFFRDKKFMEAGTGSIKDFILGIIPNIKALTDFDDADIEPKQYFIKAIPQMLACVIIGVFIYNGYYKDTAATVGEFGSVICNRVFSSVDPSSVIDTLTQTTATPDNIFANDTTIEGKMEYELSMKIYKAWLSQAKGENDSNFKTSLMRDAEKQAQDIIHSYFPYDGAKAANYKKYHVLSEAGRPYDYQITAIEVGATVHSDAVTTNTFKVTANEDNSEIYVTGYGIRPDSLKDYVTDKSYYGFSFTLKGTKSDGKELAQTAVKATAGNWNGANLAAYTVSVSCNYSGEAGNKVVRDSYAAVNISQNNLQDHINSNVGNGVTYTINKIEYMGYAKYNNETKVASVAVKGRRSGDHINSMTVRVTCYADGDTNSYVKFNIPLDITIK